MRHDGEGISVRGTQAQGTALVAVTALFFGWGFITSLIDPLVAAVKGIFSLTNVEAQLSAFAFFIAYGLVSIPASLLVARLRAVRSILSALGLMAAGCMTILGATAASRYDFVLLGLFILASGITILQVAANPLVATLGSPERSHFRLTFAQAFNALGTVLGPLVGASLLLRGLDLAPGAVLDAYARNNALKSIDHAFITIAVMIVGLGLFVWSMRRHIQGASKMAGAMIGAGETARRVFSSRWALLGGGAIFLYVGAEVSIGTQMALFLHDPVIWDVPLQRAGYFVSLYWLGAMLGRFAGSALMTRVPAHRLLAIATAIAALLCLTVLAVGGVNAGYAAILVGLFNSIMFPSIFSLTLERSTAGDEATSGVLCTAIVGGAFLPLVAGAISDAHGYASSFAIPMTCYILLCIFALLAGTGLDPKAPKDHSFKAKKL